MAIDHEIRPHEENPAESLEVLLQTATAELQGDHWKIMRQDDRLEAPWHLVVHKGNRWRVIQLLPPSTSSADRQARRRDLGETVRLPTRLGTMEQWLAHMRPNGSITFGPYVLTAQAWSIVDSTEDEALARLGLAA